MFATCLHCHGALGSNQELEAFPAGNVLAFDSAKGRPWVVFSRCSRVILLGKILVHLNDVDGNEKQVQTAVDKIDYFGSPNRLMEGELAALLAEWRQAEKVATIADELLMPARILRRLKGTHSTEAE